MKKYKVSSLILNQKKTIILLVIIIIIFTRLLLLYPSILFGNIIDLISINNFIAINYKLLILLMISILSTVLIPIMNFSITKFIQKIVREFSIKTTQDIFNKHYDFFKELNIGSNISKVDRGILSLEKFLSYFFFNAIPSITTICIIFLYFIFYTSIYISLLLLMGSLLFICVSRYLIHKRSPVLDKINDIEDSLSDFLGESISSGISIKSYGKVNSILRIFNKLFFNYSYSASKLSFISSSISSIQEMISLITTIILIYLGVFLITYQNNLTSGSFVVIFSYSSIFMNNIKILMNIYKEYLELKIDQTRLFEIIEDSNDKILSEEILVNKIFSVSIEKKIFSKNNKSILEIKENININENSSLCLLGKTGRGKTTFLEIVAGVQNSHNMVYINNIDIHDISSSCLINNICYLPQRPQFISGPINRTLFFQDEFIKNKDLIINLLEELNLYKFKELILKDANIPISTLSGGKKKRFALIRALVSSASLIILDEPTSELDAKTKIIVWKIIKKYTQNKILICATHDKIEQYFDNIVILE